MAEADLIVAAYTLILSCSCAVAACIAASLGSKARLQPTRRRRLR